MIFGARNNNAGSTSALPLPFLSLTPTPDVSIHPPTSLITVGPLKCKFSGYLLFGEKKVQVKSSIGDVIMSKDTTLSFIFDQLNLVLQIGPFLNSEQGQIPLSLREKSNQNNGGMSGHSSLCQIHNLDGIYLIENIIATLSPCLSTNHALLKDTQHVTIDGSLSWNTKADR